MTGERFENKVVVITGGGAGIGRRYAHRFAGEGAAIVVADLDLAAAEGVVKELEAGAFRAGLLTSTWTRTAGLEVTARTAAQRHSGTAAQNCTG